MNKALSIWILVLVALSATIVAAVPNDKIVSSSDCDEKYKNCLGKFINTGTNEYEYVVSTDIQPGWNIISLVAYMELTDQFSKAGKSNLIKAAYLYNPETKEYYSLAEFDKGFSSKERELAAQKFLANYDEDGVYPLALWVYIDNGEYDRYVNFKLKFGKDRQMAEKFKTFTLTKGWNFVTITPDMAITEDGTKSRPLLDSFKDCVGKVDVAYAYDAGAKKWINVMDDADLNIFRDGIGEGVGVAIVMKVYENCVVNPFTSSSAYMPPELPR